LDDVSSDGRRCCAVSTKSLKTPTHHPHSPQRWQSVTQKKDDNGEDIKVLALNRLPTVVKRSCMNERKALYRTEASRMFRQRMYLAVAIAQVLAWFCNGFVRVDIGFSKPSHRTTPAALYSSTSNVPQREPMTVGICGAGAIAFGTAAVLSQAGHKPMFWSPSGAGTADLIENTDNGNSILLATGAIDVALTPRIASTPEILARDNDVIIIALPANGHKRVLDEIAPFLEPRHSVIISSHASLGALYLAQILRDKLDRSFQVPITAWGTTICTARRSSGKEVRINTVRQSVDLCTVPHDQSEGALLQCQNLFPNVTFRPRSGLLAISLSNLNPQNHLGIALGNMSRMEKGEQWYQLLHVTPNVGRFLEALDKERLEIAKALGLETKTIFDHFSQSFHVRITDSISEMNQEIYKSGKDVYGPTTADSRYVTEDVPFGLTLTIVLGQLVNRPAMLHSSGLAIMSAMYGRNFVAENDLLDALKLDQYTLEELCEAAYSGVLQQQQQQQQQQQVDHGPLESSFSNRQEEDTVMGRHLQQQQLPSLQP
jgi:opine dehydrogenase